MNLELISDGPVFVFSCKSCLRPTKSTVGFADLDGKPFADYYCAVCASGDSLSDDDLSWIRKAYPSAILVWRPSVSGFAVAIAYSDNTWDGISLREARDIIKTAKEIGL